MKRYIYSLLLCMLFCLTGCDLNEQNRTVTGNGTLEVHYIDVEQGDAILIRQGSGAMLIDAGNNNKGTTVWSYLKSQNIDHLTYAVGTHPDADHIGGMDVVLYKIDCDTVFLPQRGNQTKTYEELISTIDQRNQKKMVPQRGDIYALGDAQFQILTDTGKDYGDNLNDYSIALRLSFGNTSFLFTGDAEKAAEQDMIDSGLTLQSDVYKAAHHGADNANTEDFLKAVSPMYCVISCGEGNSYGHPRAGVLNNLRSMNIKTFRTDEQGTVVAESDGIGITFNMSPSTTWKAGEPTGGSTKPGGKSDSSKVQSGAYIINVSTHKFHLPDCSSVEKMSDKNKEKTSLTRQQLIDAGYEPCGNCNP